MRKLSMLPLAAAVVVAIGFAGNAHAVDIFTIGTDDGSGDEFLVLHSSGGTPDGPYTFDLDSDTNPDDFIRFQDGPDEENSGTFQPNDFNPLTIQYTTACFLLPGTKASLSVDLALVRNVGAASNDGIPDPGDGAVEYVIDIDGNSVTVSKDPVDTNGSSDTPTNVGLSNPGTLSVPQADLGKDIEISMIDGWWMQFDQVSLTGDCVTDFGKISGKIGQGRGTYSFSGVIGNDTDGNGVGEIKVNYKDERSVCTFTSDGSPVITGDGLGGLATDGDADVEYSVDYECDGGDLDGLSGTATLSLDPGDQKGTNNRGGNKDRGGIAIDDAPDADVNIPATQLDNGNVLADADTSS